MKLTPSSVLNLPRALSLMVAALALILARPAVAQTVLAYDEAGNYQVSANWTNDSNQGFGFQPWVIATGGPDSHGTYVLSGNVPPFVIANLTNVSGLNYTNVWGLYANGTNDVNETSAFRGFNTPLGTNTFKVQWGARGAGVTTVANIGQVHGWCGFTLRNGNATNSAADFLSGMRFMLYFYDSASPSTLYVKDGNGIADISITGTSFSDLGRANITNAVQAELTVGADGDTYHLVLKDCVAGRTLYTLDSILAGSGSVDSAALFCHETTGDQVYNRLQISTPRNPPTIANLQPTNNALYLAAASTSVSFEVQSFSSTVTGNQVSVSLNGVLQSNLVFNTAGATNHLYVTCPTPIAPDTFYNLVITAKDTNNDSVTNVSTFNTFLATDLYIDCGDYNYSNGLFFNSATPNNAYANLFGVQGVDYSDVDLTGTNNLYRPGDLPQVLSLPTDATGDPVDHANLRFNGGIAYSLGFTDAGEWQNYTRSVSASTNYVIYARAASAAGGSFEIARLATATATTTNQPLATVGRMIIPVTGGSKVHTGQLTPLTDLFGNPVVMPLSGTNTLRCTAVSSRAYNLEYLLVAATTNATGTLRPYLSTASPAPGATGVSLTGKILFTVANRNTSVTNIQLLVNNTNVTPTLSSNVVGTAASYTPAANLPANVTNSITVIVTDSGTVKTTNTWTFVTAPTGGVPGNGLWSAGGGPTDMNWNTAANWTGGTPGFGFNAVFASLGATNTLATNNIVTTNTFVLGLYYNTNNLGYHTTRIENGVVLTVTNSSASTGPALQVGGGVNSDNVFNPLVTNTITGSQGTLMVLGNPIGSGVNNQLNFQVRQAASVATAHQVTLDMSDLGTLVAVVGKMTVGQGGSTANTQDKTSGHLFLARTNTVVLCRNVAGQFVVGDSSGAANQSAGSTLELGITNALFFDTMNLGKQKATNALVRYNPAFTNLNPATYIRGTNGALSRVTDWNIGDAATEATVPVFVSGTLDLSGGRLDAMVNRMLVGEGATTGGDTGTAAGTVTFSAGTLDVSSLKIGVQRAVNTATVAGTVNVNGSATLVSPSIILAHTNAGAVASQVTGTLNINGGTVRAAITAEGGVSTINVTGGTLAVSNSVGSAALPISVLNLSSGALRFAFDGNSTATNVFATAVAATGTTTINVDSVANVPSGAKTNHLISYTGTTPRPGLSVGSIPFGYAGSLQDKDGNIDLILTVTAPPPQPTITSVINSGGQVILGGTNNSGTGGTFSVLTSTNVALPVGSWSVLSSGSFNANGSFSSTNAIGTNSQSYYRLRIP